MKELYLKRKQPNIKSNWDNETHQHLKRVFFKHWSKFMTYNNDLTLLTWALLRGVHSVVEEHADPVAALHCTFAGMPFLALSCFPFLGCPQSSAAF